MFPDAFINEGFVDQLWSGERMPDDFGFDAAEMIVLVRVKDATRPNEAVQGQGLLQSEVMLDVVLLDPKARTRRQVGSRGVGAGFSEDAAVRLGLDRAVDQLRTKL